MLSTSVNVLESWRYAGLKTRRYPTHILSHNHCNHMCICEAIGTRKPLRLTFIHTVSTFHCFYALNFRQSPSMIEICRNQVHTNASNIFGLQPLAYHVYLWSSRHPTTAQTHGYIAGLDISLLLCSQLPPKSFNDRDMPESSPHKCLQHIRSHNH